MTRRQQNKSPSPSLAQMWMIYQLQDEKVLKKCTVLQNFLWSLYCNIPLQSNSIEVS